jgi:hypothetical protein
LPKRQADRSRDRGHWAALIQELESQGAQEEEGRNGEAGTWDSASRCRPGERGWNMFRKQHRQSRSGLDDPGALCCAVLHFCQWLFAFCFLFSLYALFVCWLIIF